MQSLFFGLFCCSKSCMLTQSLGLRVHVRIGRGFSFPIFFFCTVETMPCWDIHVYWLHTDYIYEQTAINPLLPRLQPLCINKNCLQPVDLRRPGAERHQNFVAAQLSSRSLHFHELWLSGHGHPRSLHPTPMLNVKRDAGLDGLQLHSHALRR